MSDKDDPFHVHVVKLLNQPSHHEEVSIA